MEEYVKEQQVINGWDNVSIPVLTCCIQNKSSVGYCKSCIENFRYRNGKYYKGFEYPTDDELLQMLDSGKKPLATFARCHRDKKLEKDIKKMGLHLVRKYRNRWRMLCYDVVKNSKLKLSDLADLTKIGKLLNIHLEDGLVIDLKIDQLPRVYQGLVYGYPFYTLLPYNYKSFDGDL